MKGSMPLELCLKDDVHEAYVHVEPISPLGTAVFSGFMYSSSGRRLFSNGLGKVWIRPQELECLKNYGQFLGKSYGLAN